MSSRLRRHQRILELIDSSVVRSQHDLQDLLADDGMDVTQATLSRDLRELNVVKGANGYAVPGRGVVAPPDAAMLRKTLRRELISVATGGTIVAIRTRPGHANALAAELDRYQLKDVIGTIAGDDTVFLAARSERRAKTLDAELRDLAEMD
jgi:transcriptional regulator of arginine metabolism